MYYEPYTMYSIPSTRCTMLLRAVSEVRASERETCSTTKLGPLSFGSPHVPKPDIGDQCSQKSSQGGAELSVRLVELEEVLASCAEAGKSR